ncbi:hypothetical protein FQS88_07140 [Enterococcus casseliflavus]|nr:hypothetical protein [Enterococcus casseliflavus]
MKKYRNEKSFGTIPNRMFAWGTNDWCSNDEKMVYLELFFMQEVSEMLEGSNKTMTITIETLAYALNWKTDRRSVGYNRVVKCLNSLRRKKYIHFSGEDLTARDVETFTVLILEDYETVVEADAPWSQRNNVRQFYGYTKIMSGEYRTLKVSKYDLTLYLYSKWRENIKTYQISYVEWSMILGVTDRQARTIISETVAIRKYQGAFNEVLGKNNTNSYKAKTNTYKQAEKASEKQSESTEQVSEPVVETTVETATESVVSNVKEQVVEKPVEQKEQLKTADNSVLDNEKVVSKNEASLSQSEIEKMHYFEEVERQQMEVKQIVVEKEETVESNAYVASANFIYEMSNFDKMYDDLFDEDDEPADKKSKSKSVMALTKTKDDKIQEALMKQVTDKRVKNNMSLLRQIQDFGVGMTFQAFMIIKDTDDYKLRQWGKAKIKQIASNGENGLIKMQNFEKKYQKMQPKTGVSADV